MAQRRLVILADHQLDFHVGKTAIGMLRYRPQEVVAVIDSSHAGRTTQEVVGVGGSIPIVASLQEAMPYGPTALLIGVAPRGGGLPPEWRPLLLAAIRQGLSIISGLHYFLNEDAELCEAAASAGVQLIDVRRPPATLSVATHAPHRPGSTVVTFVGSDCAVGKMTAALDVERCARQRGLDAQFVATGQTGILIAGFGVPLDRVIGDFMAGALEQLVIDTAARHDIVLVEGQGSLLHPGYSGVTLALIHGSAPDALILVTMPTRTTIDEYDIRIPPLPRLIAIYQEAAGWIKPAPVIGIALNTAGMSDREAQAAVEHARHETGLPATDTVRYGAEPLVEAIERLHSRRESLAWSGAE
jgi:uncharacterized NAD-dependent epimerase/dehydratase family protein